MCQQRPGRGQLLASKDGCKQRLICNIDAGLLFYEERNWFSSPNVLGEWHWIQTNHLCVLKRKLLRHLQFNSNLRWRTKAPSFTLSFTWAWILLQHFLSITFQVNLVWRQWRHSEKVRVCVEWWGDTWVALRHRRLPDSALNLGLDRRLYVHFARLDLFNTVLTRIIKWATVLMDYSCNNVVLWSRPMGQLKQNI